MLKSALIGLATAVVLATSAHAALLTDCAGGCTTDPFGSVFPLDYTVPTDGRLYRWDLWSDSAHPDVLINLSAPNDAFTTVKVSDGGGAFHADFGADPVFEWNEIQKPGHTEIILRGPANYDHCSSTTLAGVVCAADYNVWGNGSWLSVNTQDTVRISFNAAAIPEPVTWALMLLGFFGIGSALRRTRGGQLAPQIEA